jgi:hypothetical protein
MKQASRLLVSLALAAVLVSPTQVAGQVAGDRSFQWYWGAQAGGFYYKTNIQTAYIDPIIGAHWLITAKRTALYMSYEQAVFLTDARAVISDPGSGSSSVGAGFRDVSFSDMRRLMFGLLAVPFQRRIEPYAGGGFALMQVLNPVVDCSTCVTISEQFEAQNRAEEAASKAFFWMIGGIQLNKGKLSIFGHYLVTSAAQGFLVEGTTHTFQGGVRYSFGTAKEGITERN